jgi:hypothetical protein
VVGKVCEGVPCLLQGGRGSPTSFSPGPLTLLASATTIQNTTLQRVLSGPVEETSLYTSCLEEVFSEAQVSSGYIVAVISTVVAPIISSRLVSFLLRS